MQYLSLVFYEHHFINSSTHPRVATIYKILLTYHQLFDSYATLAMPNAPNLSGTSLPNTHFLISDFKYFGKSVQDLKTVSDPGIL